MEIDPDNNELTSNGNFCSIRGTSCIFSGCFMYEVTVLTAGIQQIGWATLNCKFNNEEGVGDSPDSYAFDGMRVKIWYPSTNLYIFK